MNAVVLVNARAGGGGPDPGEIRDALAEAGVAAQVRLAPGPALRDAARVAARGGADAVVAAGGDGTVSAVAGALAGTATPLGVLPLGTFNHFARDLGLPLDLAGAARAVAQGVVRAVDVGEVGGRVFVNNSSIGLYPLAVRERETRHLLPKPLAMGLALARMLLRFPVFALRLHAEGATLPRRAPILFVGNNAYEMKVLAPQRRETLSGGVLSIVVVRSSSRRRLLGLALKALVGRLDPGRDLETLSLPALRVETRWRRTLLVSADGEVFRLPQPLLYRIRPGALRVLVPPEATP